MKEEKKKKKKKKKEKEKEKKKKKKVINGAQTYRNSGIQIEQMLLIIEM